MFLVHRRFKTEPLASHNKKLYIYIYIYIDPELGLYYIHKGPIGTLFLAKALAHWFALRIW